jgi:preprotein translocase subunit SecE
MINKIKKFIAETLDEIKKCTWPNKKEVMDQTMLVIVSVVILAVFVAGIDWLNMWLINILTVK